MVRYLGLDVNLNNEGQKIEPLLDWERSLNDKNEEELAVGDCEIEV
ncbi:MAG: hypothetical protein SXA11_25645 [Cyanobacteriota bacterium]|nr:hypothetical protein [Cyanobacteriota bacterium]